MPLLPFSYTPLALFSVPFCQLFVICTLPETVIVPLPVNSTPPPRMALLPVMLPPLMVKLPSSNANTPPPPLQSGLSFVVVLPVMLPPLMVKLPSFASTPPP